jgi:hypothetical protein
MSMIPARRRIKMALCQSAIAAALLLGGLAAAEAQQRRPQVMWEGRFSGGREVEYIFDRPTIDWHTDARLFRSEQACERWLYVLRSEYQMWPRYSFCRRVRVQPRG